MVHAVKKGIQRVLAHLQANAYGVSTTADFLIAAPRTEEWLACLAVTADPPKRRHLCSLGIDSEGQDLWISILHAFKDGLIFDAHSHNECPSHIHSVSNLYFGALSRIDLLQYMTDYLSVRS